MINSYKSELLILFFIYLISNIFLLLNFNAIYWDDWAWFYQEDMSFGAINLFGLGIIGSYAWRTYENTKARPLSVILSVEEFDESKK